MNQRLDDIRKDAQRNMRLARERLAAAVAELNEAEAAFDAARKAVEESG